MNAIKLIPSLILPVLLLAGITTASAYGVNNEAYCIENSGTVEKMVAKYGGDVNGFSKKFCTFSKDNGFVAVGLKSFAAKTPNIAATFITLLPEISDSSELWLGEYRNPSMNVCKNLGGATISYNVVSGGFTNDLGVSDICVFGDGSMVSAWSLIYMANSRAHYDEVKNAVRSEPIEIMYIPE